MENIMKFSSLSEVKPNEECMLLIIQSNNRRYIGKYKYLYNCEYWLVDGEPMSAYNNDVWSFLPNYQNLHMIHYK